MAIAPNYYKNYRRTQTTTAGVSKLFFHISQAAEVVHQNDIPVSRGAGNVVEFDSTAVARTSDAKCNYLRPRKSFQLASLHLHL